MKPNKKANEMTVKELAAYIDYSVLKSRVYGRRNHRFNKRWCGTWLCNHLHQPGIYGFMRTYRKGQRYDALSCMCFPFGTSSTESKLKQIEIVARYDTVKEIDVVANFGHIRSGKYDAVTADLKACAELAHSYWKSIKSYF